MARLTKTSSLRGMHIGRRQLINLGIVLLLFYAVLPQIDRFRASFKVIEHSQPGWIVVALGCSLATSFIATGTYLLLAKKRIPYPRTLAVQLASLFVNRILPAGIGAIGLNFEYLRKQRHSQSSAGAVVATNNLLGLLGHLLLLTIVVLTTSVSFSQLAQPHIASAVYWFILGIAVIILVVLAWFRKFRDKLLREILGVLKDIRGYRTHPVRLLIALGLSMGLTTLYSFCLFTCARAVGVDLAFGQALIVLTVGVAGATIAPTPGGLIGAEAGLFAGLLVFKVTFAEALAIVLIYRFLTYWLALIIGAVAWGFIRRRNYI
ncbi:MAG TPA: lysylphosphatidylglycerol synthase transmembrane domain-containing protein [Candidatus Saccharimonadales bacterium]|nr:lysylphosphatidylglycerol synthase transmembrane domain-containing protein [Candidatus Saccharimonadales bacterium]